jgi:hypothetical protein
MIVSLLSSRSTQGGRLGASIAAAVWLALAPAAPAGAQMLKADIVQTSEKVRL